MKTALPLTEEAQAFVAGCDVKYDAFREWIDAMNGPLPGSKPPRVDVPHINGEAVHPLRGDVPDEWRVE